MFTLQSRKNGKYISSLTSEYHRGMFAAVHTDDAFIWTHFDAIWRFIKDNNLYMQVDVRLVK